MLSSKFVIFHYFLLLQNFGLAQTVSSLGIGEISKFKYSSLLFKFAFDDFKILLQNFGFAQAISIFENFRLGDGKRSKNQYQRHLKKHN
jgi:hypothetical protein